MRTWKAYKASAVAAGRTADSPWQILKYSRFRETAAGDRVNLQCVTGAAVL